MANPQGMTDKEYIVHLKEENAAVSEALHGLRNECAVMLSEKDRALLEKCRMCRGSVRV